MKHVLVACILCLLLAAPAMAGITVGLPADPNSGNCFPFGCAYFAEYQQVYTASLFGSSPITITNLEFFNTSYNSGEPTLQSGSWMISLSTTSADWNTISSTYTSNLGADNTLVFSGNLTQPWAFGDTLQINLTTPFTYNPSNGNLLMDVVANVGQNLSAVYFDVNGSNTYMTRVYCTGGIACSDGSVNGGYGLVTGFNQGVSSTPEPSTLLMLGSGVIGLAGLVRKRLFS